MSKVSWKFQCGGSEEIADVMEAVVEHLDHVDLSEGKEVLITIELKDLPKGDDEE